MPDKKSAPPLRAAALSLKEHLDTTARPFKTNKAPPLHPSHDASFDVNVDAATEIEEIGSSTGWPNASVPEARSGGF